jgi:hypothetical protein
MFIGVCKEGLVDEASLSLVEKEEMFFLHCGKCIAGKKFKVERSWKDCSIIEDGCCPFTLCKLVIYKEIYVY